MQDDTTKQPGSDGPAAFSSWAKLPLEIQPGSPFATMEADEFARYIEVKHGSAEGGRIMCGLAIWQALDQGSSLEEALILSDLVARECAPSFVMKAMWVGCAAILRTDPALNKALRDSLASSDN